MAGETLVVADASVVVKRSVEEEHTDAALRLMNRVRDERIRHISTY